MNPPRHWLVPVAASLVFLCLAGGRLGVPPVQVSDEIFHVPSALEFLRGLPPLEWAHPPFAKELIALGIVISGNEIPLDGAFWTSLQAARWRLSSLFAGLMTIILTYFLARMVTGSTRAGAIASGLLALDGMLLVHSRLATTNVFVLPFLIGSVLGCSAYLKTNHTRWLALAGASLGLALACRWSALAVLGVMPAFALWAWHARTFPKTERWRALGLIGVSFTLVPAMVYGATYLPMVYGATYLPGLSAASGASWLGLLDPEWIVRQVGRVIGQQSEMWAYQRGPIDPHPFQSPWWTWPLLLKPTYYFFEYKNGLVSAIWAIGNPFLWWSAVPALFFLGAIGLREWRRDWVLIATSGFALWLSWSVVGRQGTYAHYMLESIPFVCVGLGALVSRILASDRLGVRVLGASYLVGVAMCAAHFYPLQTAIPTPVAAYGSRLWLGDSWNWVEVITDFRSRHGLEAPEAWRAYQREMKNREKLRRPAIPQR